MVNGFRYYRALESVSISSALSTALTINPCQIRVHQRWQSKLQLPTARKKDRRPATAGNSPQAVGLPVNTVIHTTLVGLEPATFRLLVRRATNSATEPTRWPWCDRANLKWTLNCTSVVVKDLRLKDEDKDKDLKIGPRGFSKTMTFLEDNNVAACEAVRGEIDMNLNLTGAQWQISHSSLSHCKTMVLDISHATLAYSIFENFRGLELPRTRTRSLYSSTSRTRTRTRTLVLEASMTRTSLEDNNTGLHW